MRATVVGGGQCGGAGGVGRGLWVECIGANVLNSQRMSKREWESERLGEN